MTLQDNGRKDIKRLDETEQIDALWFLSTTTFLCFFVFVFVFYANGEQLTHVQKRCHSIIDVENGSMLSWERNAL